MIDKVVIAKNNFFFFFFFFFFFPYIDLHFSFTLCASSIFYIILQVPSCVAASPEGFVRYWPSIAHEGSYFEVSTELQVSCCHCTLYDFLSLHFEYFGILIL